MRRGNVDKIAACSSSYNKSDDLKVNSLKLVYILFCSLLGKLFVRNPSIIPKINSR